MHDLVYDALNVRFASEQEKAEPAAVEAERPKGDGKEVDLEAGPSDAGQDMTQFFEEVKP